MAAITHTEISTAAWRTALMTRVQELRDYMAARTIYRTTLRELSNLTNRELADLGLSRSGLKGIAWETAFTK